MTRGWSRLDEVSRGAYLLLVIVGVIAWVALAVSMVDAQRETRDLAAALCGPVKRTSVVLEQISARVRDSSDNPASRVYWERQRRAFQRASREISLERCHNGE